MRSVNPTSYPQEGLSQYHPLHLRRPGSVISAARRVNDLHQLTFSRSAGEVGGGTQASNQAPNQSHLPEEAPLSGGSHSGGW